MTVYNFDGVATGSDLSVVVDWSRVSGTANDIIISSIDALTVATAGVDSCYAVDTGSADHAMEVTYSTAQSGTMFPCCVRVTDNDNWIGVRHNSGDLELFRKESGSFNSIGTDYTTTISDTDRVKVIASGNDISVELNDVVVIGPVTDSFNNTETNIGIIGRGSSLSNLISRVETFVAAGGLTLDSVPVTMAKAETGLEWTVSTPATVPTVGNSSVISGGDPLTVTGVTGSDPYVITTTAPLDISKQVGSYAWTVTVSAENVVSSSIPLTVQSGWTNIVLDTPLTTVGYMLNGFTGDAPVTNDTMEFETTTDLSPGLDSEWIWDVAPTVTQVVARRVIQIDGTVGATANVTFIVNDVIDPILTLPTGTKTDYESGTGTVTTDEGNGTLFFYASTNVSETLATIKASGSSQGVSGTGVQNVTFTGLISSTTYYAHYIHTDASTNDSNVVSSTSFLTDTAPAAIISLPTGVETGHQTGLGTITTDLGEGTLYFLASTNSSELAAAIKNGTPQAITSSGLKNVTFIGLTPSTVYYAHYIHTNTGEVDSNIESSTSFTTDAAPIDVEDDILRNVLRSPLKNILRTPIK